MPVDRDQVLNGNIVLVAEGMRTIARVVRADAATMGYVSHFVTCPNSKEHRRA